MKKIGFVVGKFTPFHLGHKYLIDTAVEQCDLVYVLPYSNPDLGMSGADRWSQLFTHYSEHGRGKVYVLSPNLDRVPHNNADPMIHRKFCLDTVIGFITTIRACYPNEADNFRLPTTVFTSEDYGDGLAKFFQDVLEKPVTHVCVDIGREKFPISGTEIRQGSGQQFIVR